MSFKEMLSDDVNSVFLNPDEFADEYTIIYGGQTFKNVPAVLDGRTDSERERYDAGHIQGLYRATHEMWCALDALGGVQPETGSHIQICGAEGRYHDFHVAESEYETGMLWLALEEIR